MIARVISKSDIFNLCSSSYSANDTEWKPPAGWSLPKAQQRPAI